MAAKEIKVDRETPPVSQLEKDIIPESLSVIKQYMSNLPVNEDKLKYAYRFLLSYKGFKTLEKEEKKINLAERRHNFNVVSLYGSENMKQNIKNLISKSFDKMKFIE